MILFIIVAGALITGFLASQKQRNVPGWAVFGALFPVIGIIAIACTLPLDGNG